MYAVLLHLVDDLFIDPRLPQFDQIGYGKCFVALRGHLLDILHVDPRDLHGHQLFERREVRIVTVIDVRSRLSLPPRDGESTGNMGVTVEQDHDLYTLLVDKIGDVIGLSKESYEKNPATLDPKWREFSNGVFRLEESLMVVLDIDNLLDFAAE